VLERGVLSHLIREGLGSPVATVGKVQLNILFFTDGRAASSTRANALNLSHYVANWAPRPDLGPEEAHFSSEMAKTPFW
jgi:hypothetical protein